MLTMPKISHHSAGRSDALDEPFGPNVAESTNRTIITVATATATAVTIRGLMTWRDIEGIAVYRPKSAWPGVRRTVPPSAVVVKVLTETPWSAKKHEPRFLS